MALTKGNEVQLVTGTRDALQPELIAELGRYRHKVFVEKLGWAALTAGNSDADQYDRADTLYVIGRNEAADVVACARLLPTTRPYLLSGVFPQLMHGLPTPVSAEVWELSRFAAIDFNTGPCRCGRLGQFSSPKAVSLLRACMDSAAERGATRLISVSPLGVERLLKAVGISSCRAGPPMLVNGQLVFACWISI